METYWIKGLLGLTAGLLVFGVLSIGAFLVSLLVVGVLRIFLRYRRDHTK